MAPVLTEGSCHFFSWNGEQQQWDDGEQVTWKRASLAGRPLEILDADDQTTAPAATDAAEESAAANEADPPAVPADTAAVEPTATLEQAPGETQPQGLRITACLNYCAALDFVKRLPLRFSSERPFFQEEKHDHHCAIRRPVLRATP
jgi:hypothetical protein